MEKSSVTSPTPPAVPAPRSPFVDLETLRNSDGITGIISQRRRNGALTCGIFRVMDDEDGPTKTTFVPEHLIPRWIEMAQMLMKRCAEIHAGTSGIKLPFPVRP